MSASDTPITDKFKIAIVRQSTYGDTTVEEEYLPVEKAKELERELTAANAKLAEAKQDLFIQMASCKLLGRVVNEKDADRIYWRDEAAKQQAKLAEYESVVVPEEPKFIRETRRLSGDSAVEGIAYIDTLLRAYRAQAVRPQEAERDAERYRYLRDQTAIVDGFWIARGIVGQLTCWNGQSADAAIDAALAQGRKGGGE